MGKYLFRGTCLFALVFIIDFMVIRNKIYFLYKEVMRTVSKIRVDIEDLVGHLNEMLEDDYITAELHIEEDMYSSELRVCAVGIDDEAPVDYGTLSEVSDEL